MKRMEVLAKVLLGVLGLYGLYYCLIQVGLFLYFLVSYFMHGHISIENQTAFFSAFAGYLLVGGIIIWIAIELLFRGETWAKKIVGQHEYMEAVEPAKGISEIVIYYRLAFVCCGVLMVFWAISPLLKYTIEYWYTDPRVTLVSYLFQQHLVGIVTAALRVAAGIYFIVGAPHLMRWHVWKINEEVRREEG